MNSNTTINTYTEVTDYIESIPKFTKKNTLAHTREFLRQLNIREDNMKIIHVAGTNGKGSVCAMISSILVGAGKRTGTFISPHLIVHNERIRLNNLQIDNDEFINAYDTVKKAVDDMEKKGYPHPSYFEYLFLMAMYVFDRNDMEYVVLETGLGGRLDATNSILNPIITIITSIGFDHMEYLGNTISDIASEKAGIIKEGVPVVFWAENREVSDVIKRKAAERKASLYPVTSKDYKIIIKTNKSVDFSVQNGYYLGCAFSVPFICEYQVQNSMLALNAVSLLEDIRDNKDIIRKALETVSWEGRMELVADNVIFDGAHNGPGIDAFIKTFNEYVCTGRKMILFSVVKDKDYDYMVSQISKTDVEVVYVTGLESSRGLAAETIERDFKLSGCTAEIITCENAHRAYQMALENKGLRDVLFVVGSLYLIGELKKGML